MSDTHPFNQEPQSPGLQSMRMLFKKYQKMNLHEIDSDELILDSRRLDDAAGVETSYLISSYQLKVIFDGFTSQEECSDERALKDATVYSLKGLPGLLIAPAILPPHVQSQLLSCLLHRDLSDPKHQTNLHLHYDLPYPGVNREGSPHQESAELAMTNDLSFFSYFPSSSTVFVPKDPTVHRALTINKVMQRSLRWITLGGQYDWTNKVYPKEEPPAFPSDIGDLLEKLFPGTKAQAAIVNFYSPGDTLSVHRDVSENSDRGLISVSLGCDGIFMIGLGNHPSGCDTMIIRLRSGDVIYMSKDARFAYHAVPKVIPGTCPSYLSSWPADQDGSKQYEEWRGWMENKRINLNVRQMHD